MGYTPFKVLKCKIHMENLAKIIYQSLGPGYSESMYHRAFEVLLRKDGIQYETERIVPIVFEGHTIGNLRIDLIVEGTIIVELKAIAKLNEAAKIQAKNYLKLTGLPKAILINFPQSLTPGLQPEILAFEQIQ
jgi:GxxExxY protein